MKKIVLHIGSHKTATSSIQKAMYKNFERLKEHSIHPIFEYEANEFSNLGVFFKNTIGKADGFLECGAELNKKFYSFMRSRDVLYSTEVLSSEEFSFITDKNVLNELKELLLESYDKIEVVVYLRRQDRQIISHHQQTSRAPGASTHIYGNDPVAIPNYRPSMDIYLDYYSRLIKWSEVFGLDSIKIFDFDFIASSDIGVVNHFFNYIGFNDKVLEIRDNTSFGKITTKIKHLSMKVGFSREESFIFNNLIDGDRTKMLPSMKQAIDICQIYRKSNVNLIKHFNLDRDNFFINEFNYPESTNSDWTEEEANTAITALLSIIKSRYDSN